MTKNLAALAVVLFGFGCTAISADETPTPSKKPHPERAALEKELEKRLTGSTLVGRFDVDGRHQEGKPGADRYDISRAEKIQGNRWLITARVKYGQHDLTVPVPIDILWAGDTPVMSLTDLTIPAMGTFTARVMIYGDRYAGTWQHGKVGGHMWGKIERTAPSSTPAK